MSHSRTDHATDQADYVIPWPYPYLWSGVTSLFQIAVLGRPSYDVTNQRVEIFTLSKVAFHLRSVWIASRMVRTQQAASSQ